MRARSSLVDSSLVLKPGLGLWPGDCLLENVSWLRAVSARVWWWLWPFGASLVVIVVALLMRGAARGRFDSVLRIMIVSVVAGTIFVVVKCRKLERQHSNTLCRLAVPTGFAHMTQLRSRRSIEPRVLSTAVVVLADGRGIGLIEGDGVISLRDFGTVLILACSPRGRIGWARLSTEGLDEPTACSGSLKRHAKQRLFESASSKNVAP